MESKRLALDDVQDPGNLGTIIRLADWFGIEHIFCSAGTADVYNPKTVQATMGALARVKVHYCSLPQLIESLADIPVYGTFLSGNIIYAESLSAHGLIVMGNEGKGVLPQGMRHAMIQSQPGIAESHPCHAGGIMHPFQLTQAVIGCNTKYPGINIGFIPEGGCFSKFLCL